MAVTVSGRGLATVVALALGAPAVALAAPVNTAPPSFPSTVRYGDTARCAPGTWSPDAVSFSFAWVFNGSTRATGPTIRLDDPYYRYGVPLTCQVTATDAAGAAATATSAGVIPRPARPTLRIAALRMLSGGRIEVRGVVGPAGLEGLLGRGTSVVLTRPLGDAVTQIGGPVTVDARGRFTVRGTDAAGRRRVTVRFNAAGGPQLFEQATVTRSVVFTPGARGGGGGGGAIGG